MTLIITLTACQKAPEATTHEAETDDPGYVQTVPIVRADCFSAEGYVFGMVEAGEGRVLILSEKMLEEGAQDGETAKRITLVDYAENRILFEKDAENVDELIGVGPNGEIVTLQYDGNIISIYDSTFEKKTSAAPDDAHSIQFDRQSGSVYCLDCECFVRIDPTGEQTVLCNLFGACSVVNVDPQSGVILVNDGDLSSQGGGLSDFTLYSIRDKEVLYSLNAGGFLAETGEDFWYEANLMDPESYEFYASYVKKCRRDDGKTELVYALPTDGYVSQMGKAGYALWCRYGFDITDRNARYRMLDLNAGKAAEFTLGDNEASLSYGQFVGNGDYYACCATELDGTVSLYLVAPQLLEYSVTLEETSEKEAEPAKPVPEALLSSRVQADRLEEEYSVEILLGDECLMGDNLFAYRVISTEDGSFSGYAAGHEDLDRALAELEEALSFYPDGFFKTFRNYRGAAGVRFFLVRDLQNESGSFVPGGVCNCMDGWYNIALDVDGYGDLSSIHHEIWHAAEERVKASDPNAFLDEDWDRFNPEGFMYVNDFDNYTTRDDLERYTLSGAGKDAYFTRIYSITTEREDRATLIEEVFCQYYERTRYGYAVFTEIKDCPKLAAKLDEIALRVKGVFGSVYWEKAL